MVQAIQKFGFSMVRTIEKPNKMAAILSTIKKLNTNGKQNLAIQNSSPHLITVPKIQKNVPTRC